MTKEEYWFWLCNIKGLYQNQIQKLINVFHDPEDIYKASESLINSSGVLDPGKVHEIVMSRNRFRGMYKLDKLKRDGIRFIYYGSSDYPESFAVLPDKPFSIYVKGNLPDPDYPSAAIIGARSCSGYGREMALKYAQTLAASRIQIISGMAVGIDSYASQGAIEAGGRTFVVLGSGLDVIYPAQNIELYYQIVLSGGGIISEYPMGTSPVGWQFPHRNRLISALADKVLVIEARKRSGTLTTASYALSQGKDIYALPGRTTDPMSEGCNRMIADGAGVLIDPTEFLEEYSGFFNPEIIKEQKGIQADTAASEQDPNCKTINGIIADIYKVLDYEPKMAEEIAAACECALEDVSLALTEMELMGLCIQALKDYYIKA